MAIPRLQRACLLQNLCDLLAEMRDKSRRQRFGDGILTSRGSNAPVSIGEGSEAEDVG